MCPFCMGTAVWIAASIISTGGLSALAVAKAWNGKARQPKQGGSNDEQ